ncbi:MFS transporter [Acinetobacter qingfengensis]|uniref:Transporter n=1 Tax=Acinetobacter qingfengensis TaxID=1262585 RepID=A0A1E7RDJ6_9GAMM|nr:MFS transporter [Acinetobacter qingfengensis]KAA8735377.1 MFS transporter [Acinetobacter qingfengensis]OEY97297.1 transporter [Acinetobacter qingfengensis]
MSNTSKNWGSAFSAFLDRRAIIMLFLGFSSGLPIFLIFSVLSFWLSEAGVNRSSITMFSWAALAYSFKFIWAPLIDKLPIIFLTKKLGQRRSWLLVSQFMVISAIILMAMIDPVASATGENVNLKLLAAAAVFLGFSSATQDIIVDAYRIELTQDKALQTVLASTYNAGYRIATIITQFGALLFAASLGTAAGNYIYEAWQSTYLLMASLMLIGIITTLVIHEPQVKRVDSHYSHHDYLQLMLVFILSTSVFVMAFIFCNTLKSKLNIEDAFLGFIVLAIQFIFCAIIAFILPMILIKTGIIQKKIVMETWVNPFLDFFRRYGLKIALAILLLIGFYRISDIVAGTMANLFYVDLNFDKEEIAWFNKLFAVIFVILGGFIGGLLSQRYNIMKMMFLGAILASATNLIFVGLVKSGYSMNDVVVNTAKHQYLIKPDEVGNWKITIPQQQLQAQNSIRFSSKPEGLSQNLSVEVPLKTYHQHSAPDIYIKPIGGDNILFKNELARDVIIQGNLLNIPANSTDKKVEIMVNNKKVLANVNDNNQWSAVVNGKDLKSSQYIQINADYKLQQQIYHLTAKSIYQINLQQMQPVNRINLLEIPAVNVDQTQPVEFKGKVVVQYSKIWLVMGIIFDNLASGLAGAVFIAFLSSLTSVSFTAMQYAIFSSLMLLLPKTIGGYSGTMVDQIGYSGFFTITFLMGIPILLLVLWVAKLLKQHEGMKE